MRTHTGGGVHLRENGHVLVSYGSAAKWIEYDIDGTPLCGTHIGAAVNFSDGSVSAYRIIKHAWAGRPRTKPDIFLTEDEVAVSWNGATEVDRWAVEGTNTMPDSNGKIGEGNFSLITVQPKNGFETILQIGGSRNRIIRVVALDAEGNVMARSPATPWSVGIKEIAVAQTRGGVWAAVLTGLATISVLGWIIVVIIRRYKRWKGKSLGAYELAKLAEPEFVGDEYLDENEAGVLLPSKD